MWKIINDTIRQKNVKQPFHEVTLNSEKVTGVALTECFNDHFVNTMTSSDSVVSGTAVNSCMHSIFFSRLMTLRFLVLFRPKKAILLMQMVSKSDQ